VASRQAVDALSNTVATLSRERAGPALARGPTALFAPDVRAFLVLAWSLSRPACSPRERRKSSDRDPVPSHSGVLVSVVVRPPRHRVAAAPPRCRGEQAEKPDQLPFPSSAFVPLCHWWLARGQGRWATDWHATTRRW